VGDCLTQTLPDRAGAVLIEGERIAEVGFLDDLSARHPGVRQVRVEWVTPGVHDAHVHALKWGRALRELDLSGLVEPAEVASRVAERARTLPPGTWILGRGFLFDSYPDSSLLDAASPRHPSLLLSRDLHGAWLNQVALAQVGLDAMTPDPVGGRVLRGADGRPNGFLLEKAVTQAHLAVPPPDRDDLTRGLGDLARRGYCAVHSMALEPPETLEWAEELAVKGDLPLRIWWAVDRDVWRSVTPGWRGEDLEVAALKMFADGSLGSRTAWMVEPYTDGTSGMPVDTVQVIREEGLEALRAGFGLVVHAIGTRAVSGVLRVLTDLAPLARKPLRVEHVQHLRDVDVPLLRAAGLAFSMQPIHLLEDAALARSFLPGHEHEAFRLRDVMAAGQPVAFGSDAPVAPPDVEASLRMACHHPLTPAQSVSREEALWALTRGAALAAGWDDYGELRPGARADLGLWEGNRLVGRVFKGRLEWC
jgi:predicted amidohydrolase YtcJ